MRRTRRGNGVTVPAVVTTARETVVTEVIRIKLDNRRPAAAFGAIMEIMARIEKGWRPVAVNIEVEKGSAVYGDPVTGV